MYKYEQNTTMASMRDRRLIWIKRQATRQETKNSYPRLNEELVPVTKRKTRTRD